MLSLSVEAWYQVVYTAISRDRVGEGMVGNGPPGCHHTSTCGIFSVRQRHRLFCRVEVFSLGVVDSGRPRPRMYTAVDTYVETSNEGTFKKNCGR